MLCLSLLTVSNAPGNTLQSGYTKEEGTAVHDVELKGTATDKLDEPEHANYTHNIWYVLKL